MSSVTVPQNLPEMEYRFVGKSGLQISAISLGGWLTYGGHVGDENTFACLKAAFDAGINFFDCAEGYARGEFWFSSFPWLLSMLSYGIWTCGFWGTLR